MRLAQTPPQSQPRHKADHRQPLSWLSVRPCPRPWDPTFSHATLCSRLLESLGKMSRSFDNRLAMHDNWLTLHDNRLPCPLPRLPARLAQGRRFVEVPRRLLLRRWRHRWVR